MVEGLSFLHDRGIVHRDLKPGNVFLENGVVKIGDVGLSKFISESHRSAQTQSVGTVYYMAPEVAHGRYGREVDVYSLGIVAYELLTGRVPFIGESAGEILMKHLSEKPDLSPIPRRLRPVLAESLEKDPLRRTPNVRQFLDNFNKAVAGFDVPQEIPEESFLNATLADSSAAGHRPGGRPVNPLSSVPRGPVPPNLKNIIASDVARAMAVAEKAARRAKEMADEAYRASRGHRRFASRIQRRQAKWQRAQQRCRDRYATIWGWKAQYKSRWQKAERTAQANAPNPKGQNGGDGGTSRRWVKPLLIALVVLAFIPGPRAFGVHAVHGGIVSIALLVAIAYFAYKAWDGPALRTAGTPPFGPTPGMAGQPVGSPAAAATPIPPTPPPPPLPVKAYRSIVLNPDTPRWIPMRQRMSQLSLSLTYAAISTVLITAGLAAVTEIFADKAQIAQFAGTLLVSSWLVLAQAKLWEGRTLDVGMRRLPMFLTGAAIGAISFWLNRVLVADIPNTEHVQSAIQTIGSHSLTLPGTNGQPSLAGYMMFFVCLIAIPRWWRRADSFRNVRLAIFSIVPTAFLALLLTGIFAFPTVWGTVWAAAISATVQLSASWVPPRDRAALVQGASHHG